MMDKSGKQSSKSSPKDKKDKTEAAESDAEENPFIIKEQVKEEEESDTRKGMKTSDEIKIYDVGEASVIDYVETQEQTVIEYDETADKIELEADKMERLDVSTAKTVQIDGKTVRDDLGKELKADFKSLQKAEFDKSQMYKDIMRNIDEYRPICISCRGTLKCKSCDGKGKKALLFKCSICKGTGLCPYCEELEDAECPNCCTKISVYSITCHRCGAAFGCPSCFSPIPITATRCLRCRTVFKCQYCKEPVAPGVDRYCAHCGSEKWFKRPKRELPIRKLEKE